VREGKKRSDCRPVGLGHRVADDKPPLVFAPLGKAHGQACQQIYGALFLKLISAERESGPVERSAARGFIARAVSWTFVLCCRHRSAGQ